MDLLKKIFPLSFAEKKDVAALVINVLIYLAVGLVAGIIIKIFAGIPVLNVLLIPAGAIIDLYSTGGIVLSFLHYFKVLK